MELAVLIYEYGPDILERREPHRAGHLALIERMATDGRLLIAGAVGDPPTGAHIVFSEPAAAEQFVAADPYVQSELVTEHRIEPWNVVAHRPLPEGP